MTQFSEATDLSGRVAIVTGGARGMGLATATLLAEAGASVVIGDLDREATDAAVAQLGEKAAGHVGDITLPGEPDALVAAALERFGQLDIVVNNAGYNWDAPLVEMTDEQWEAMLAIHATAPFRVLRAAGPHMIGSRAFAHNRKVVNMSSVSGTMGEPWQQNYNAGKAAVLGLTKGLAREWAPHQINVNAVAPGIIDTRLTRSDDAGESIDVGGHHVPLGLSEERRGDLTDVVPLGRPGTVEEVASLVFFLCTPAADYIHGQVLSVTGGLVMGMSS
ncbi:MAG TPA: SDR family NAD(P)-dependent oxidoreductase [Solirubrobacteraceae bacterium]|nr:SDR family NAD(P)-dependent oxidoreductase [Solirubrobacteraceae bacterium]